MALEIIGKLVKVLPRQSGNTARGTTWSKQEFILETLENDHRNVCISTWDERIMNNLSAIAEGDILKVPFSVESREYKERWYTNVRAFSIEKQATAASVGNAAVSTNTSPSSIEVINQQEVDDLPF